LTGCIDKNLIPRMIGRFGESEPNSKNILVVEKSPHSLYFNDMTTCITYALKLKAHVLKDVDHVWKHKKDNQQQEELQKAINLLDDIVRMFTDTAQETVKHISNALADHITPDIRVFARANYQMTLADFNKAQINDPWVEMFLIHVRTILSGYRDYLTTESIDMLVIDIVKYVTSEIEATVLQKNFSQHGGLQFDSDVQKIMNFFESNTTKTVRDKFLRLNEIKDLLVLEKPTEVLEYWGTEGVKWSLTAVEVKLFLKRRTDFPPNVIERLKLQ